MIERALGRPLPRCSAPDVEPDIERKTTIRGRKIDVTPRKEEAARLRGSAWMYWYSTVIIPAPRP